MSFRLVAADAEGIRPNPSCRQRRHHPNHFRIHNNLDRIQENETERDALALRIRDRLAPIRQQYLDFLKRHPQHARARVAYGSFLTHIDHRQGY